MKEYKRILLPLQKEKLLVIAAVCSYSLVDVDKQSFI